MMGLIKTIGTIAKIGTKLAEVKKEIDTSKQRTQELEKYAYEPNENNVEIEKLKDKQSKQDKAILSMQKEIKKLKGNKKTDDKKWYDE